MLMIKIIMLAVTINYSVFFKALLYPGWLSNRFDFCLKMFSHQRLA